MQKRVAYKEENCGLGLAADSRSAYDITDNALRLTVLRSPAYADHFAVRDGLMEYTEQGEQSFRIALTPVESDYTQLYRLGENLLNPPMSLLGTYHNGKLASEGSVLNIGSENIKNTAFKPAEDGNGYILRCHKTTGKNVSAVIDIPFLGINKKVYFTAQQIKTFHINDGKISETDFTEKI